MRIATVLSVLCLAATLTFTGCSTTRGDADTTSVSAPAPAPVTGSFTLIELEGKPYYGPQATINLTPTSINGNGPGTSFSGPVTDNEIGRLDHSRSHSGGWADKRRDDAYLKILQGGNLIVESNGVLAVKSWRGVQARFKRN